MPESAAFEGWNRRTSERLAKKLAGKDVCGHSITSKPSVQKTGARRPLGKMDTNHGERQLDLRKQEPNKKRRFSFFNADDWAEPDENAEGCNCAKQHEVDEMRAELDALKAKYDKLKELRFSDVENIYKRYKDSVQERTTAADALMNWYKDEADRLRTLTQHSKEVNAYKDLEAQRRENAALQGQVLDLKAELLEAQLKCLEVEQAQEAPVSSRAVSKVEEPAVRMEEPSKAVVKLFEVLTGAVVKAVESDLFDIRVINPEDRRQIRFQVKLTDRDLEYEPLELESVNVPGYMRESIVFKLSEAHIFFSKVYATVFAR